MQDGSGTLIPKKTAVRYFLIENILLLFSIYTILRIEWPRYARLAHYCKIL
ncbi:hypothetical protein SASK131_21450 [Staphylococcus argenteus]|nr:hypothetical protein TMSFP064_19080 [Staphylococcus argenteus]BCN91535.1 hypothetical protein TMSFP069_19100 [Staphylococcus argenteus]GJF40159.1 hypothetical protein SA19056_23660 [Staphylococcus argenteus]GJF42789.1 hypothetical protein SA19059_24410 [Staphylococcus argenteus]GJF47732.1 hypothetical protein SA19080_22480 [Staphylococcus argenteus]